MFHPLRLSLLGLWFLIATGFAETPEQGFQRFAAAMKAGDKAAVWSAGPNGKDEQGAGDDVVSWK